jgi:hypothetical protein
VPNGKLDDDGLTPQGDVGQVFTPEMDEVIREIKMLQYGLREPSRFDPGVDRRRKPKVRDAIVALRDRLRRRHEPSGSE